MIKSNLIEKTMNTTLLIMSAGIGSRFGTGIKQLEPVDASNHVIMDYSIHDAIEAGFNHVVFIIRKDIEKEFKEVIGDRIRLIYLQTCDIMEAVASYAAHNNITHLSVVSSRQRSYGRRRCEKKLSELLL